MKSRVKYLKRPKLNRPVMVAGLPGIANIGKLALEYLIHKLAAQKFIELYSEHFPEWVIQEGGAVKPLKVDFLYCRPNGLKNDLILVTSDAQAATPMGQYILTGEILDMAMQHGVTAVGTIAAYVISPGETRSSAVVGATSDLSTAKILAGAGVELLDGGTIVGMNGMLPAMAASRGIKGFCLLGITQGGLLDASAASAVLKALSSILGFKLDLQDLEKDAERIQRLKLPPVPMEPQETTEEEPSYIR
jgi:uncharacterized protein (TIGR00162 family)